MPEQSEQAEEKGDWERGGSSLAQVSPTPGQAQSVVEHEVTELSRALFSQDVIE
jgi:hypothetical protein